MKYFIKTFGCQMNHSDSERIAAYFEENNIEVSSSIHEADLAVFNTCGVRQMAEDRIYGQIHNLRKAKPQIKIILTGCLANRKDVRKKLKNKTDLFIEIKDISSTLDKLGINQKEYTRDYLSLLPKNKNNFQAHIPIMTGCNNFCAYCVVPYARGREVSRSAEEILEEIKNAIKRGCKEIILLGQNVNSYSDPRTNFRQDNSLNKDKPLLSKLPSTSDAGSKVGAGVNFSKLLRKVNSIPGKFWIQFISSHPKDATDEFIETVTKLKKVCEYIHLPIQSGDNEILRRMNRKYTSAYYLKLVGKIKRSFEKYKPNTLYSITSDIIVGFPEETRGQFMESASIMKKAGYDMVYFGQYSPRPNTAAWNMKDNVSKREKVRREKYLNEILKKTALKNNKNYAGKILEVLIDKEEDGYYFGRTRSMKHVKFSSDKKRLAGKFVKVRIIKSNAWNLEGKLKIKKSKCKITMQK